MHRLVVTEIDSLADQSARSAENRTGLRTNLLIQRHHQTGMVTRHDSRFEPCIMMSRSHVLFLALRSTADVDGVEVRGKGQGAEGKDVGKEEGMEGDNR